DGVTDPLEVNVVK
nr:RecName: Full=Unknown protein 7 [Pinus halepensis]